MCSGRCGWHPPHDKPRGIAYAKQPTSEPATPRTSYYIDTYVPEWLAASESYRAAVAGRLADLMAMQEYRIVAGPCIQAAITDCPPAVGMTTLRAVCTVEEFDVDVPLDGE